MRHRPALLLLLVATLVVAAPLVSHPAALHAEAAPVLATRASTFEVRRVELGPGGVSIETASGTVDPVSQLAASRVTRDGVPVVDLVVRGEDAYARRVGAGRWYLFDSAATFPVLPFGALGGDVDPRQVLLGVAAARDAGAAVELGPGGGTIRTHVGALLRMADEVADPTFDRIVASHLGPAADGHDGVVAARISGADRPDQRLVVVAARAGHGLVVTALRTSPTGVVVLEPPDDAVRIACGCGGS